MNELGPYHMDQKNTAFMSRKQEEAIRIYPAQMGTQAFGRLLVRTVTAGILPIENATINITSTNNPNLVFGQLTSNSMGLTEVVELPAPPYDYSQEPSSEQPYSEYTLHVTAPEFTAATFSHVQILPDVTSEQNASLNPETPMAAEELFVIPPHTLFGDYPPKIPEDEVKPAAETGEIVLNRAVVPEYVIVHDGPPSDPSAANHYVRFRDYIKNVASNEIYSTWPESTLYANILAILSFTLNRVYTEWYRNQGYNFTITSSTAYDHKWANGRNIYTNIGMIVDDIFVNYLSRPNVSQPILTQYCDGYRTQCPGWMTQWGSKALGDQGYEPIEILRNFYGNSIYINTAPGVAGVPVSWPGSNLGIGAQGDNVRMIQQQLNTISDVYTAIPKIAADGIYGPKTEEAVRTFQRIFNLPQTGIIDRATWYRISQIYVGVARLAEA